MRTRVSRLWHEVADRVPYEKTNKVRTSDSRKIPRSPMNLDSLGDRQTNRRTKQTGRQSNRQKERQRENQRKKQTEKYIIQKNRRELQDITYESRCQFVCNFARWSAGMVGSRGPSFPGSGTPFEPIAMGFVPRYACFEKLLNLKIQNNRRCDS